MEPRDLVFRERLVDLMARLNGPEGKRVGFRNRLGALSKRIATDAGARSWADLKARADGPTYDSLLAMFQRESAGAQKAGDERVQDAFEVLAISLIARRQQQADLMPGIALLDRFIEDSEKAAALAKTQVISPARSTH